MKKLTVAFLGGMATLGVIQATLNDELGFPARPQIEAARVQASTVIATDSTKVHELIQEGRFTEATIYLNKAILTLRGMGEKGTHDELEKLQPALLKAGDVRGAVQKAERGKNPGTADIDVATWQHIEDVVYHLRAYINASKDVESDAKKTINLRLKADAQRIFQMLAAGRDYARSPTHGLERPAYKYQNLINELKELLDQL